MTLQEAVAIVIATATRLRYLRAHAGEKPGERDE